MTDDMFKRDEHGRITGLDWEKVRERYERRLAYDAEKAEKAAQQAQETTNGVDGKK